MSEEVKKVAQEQAEQAYDLFLNISKKVGWAIGLIFVVLVSCNFGVDGTGSRECHKIKALPNFVGLPTQSCEFVLSEESLSGRGLTSPADNFPGLGKQRLG